MMISVVPRDPGSGLCGAYVGAVQCIYVGSQLRALAGKHNMELHDISGDFRQVSLLETQLTNILGMG